MSLPCTLGMTSTASWSSALIALDRFGPRVDQRLWMEGVPGKPKRHEGRHRLLVETGHKGGPRLRVIVDTDLLSVDFVQQRPLDLRQLLKRIGLVHPVDLQSQHPFLGMVPGVGMLGLEHHFGALGVAVVWILV